MTHLVPLAQALGPLRDVYQHLISAAVRWQDGRSRRTDPDQFVLLCVAADAGGAASPTRWTRTAVYQALRRDVPTWCSLHRCPWPAELPEAFWEWLDFLSDTGRLDGASDPLWELRKPLLCYGGLDAQGRLHAGPPGGPPGTGPPAVACECGLPYRDTAALLNGLGRLHRTGLLGPGAGDGPLDVLRALVGDRVLGDGVLGDGILGDGILGDGILGDGILGDGILGDGILGDGVLGDAAAQGSDGPGPDGLGPDGLGPDELRTLLRDLRDGGPDGGPDPRDGGPDLPDDPRWW